MSDHSNASHLASFGPIGATPTQQSTWLSSHCANLYHCRHTCLILARLCYKTKKTPNIGTILNMEKGQPSTPLASAPWMMLKASLFNICDSFWKAKFLLDFCIDKHWTQDDEALCRGHLLGHSESNFYFILLFQWCFFFLLFYILSTIPPPSSPLTPIFILNSSEW